MKNDKKTVLDNYENELLESIEAGEWEDHPLIDGEAKNYQNYARYTKALQEKRQTSIRFSVSDLAIIKAKAKGLGIGYQNLIQALVHNYATGKVKIEL